MVATLSSFVAAHTALVLAFVAVTGALIYTELARLTRGYRAISPAQVTDLINRENALVVDIRALADFEKGHIVGARHMVLSQFDPENKA
ncbi:MAG: rhodanese-like domain-containing protein, partial [Xanthomonadaceae bacterium]|nr:rhodanese-like domain-containing protein [Xanthomonadaceae bacterium]